MPLIIPANSITGGFEVANSLRFDDGSSDYLNRTTGTPTDGKKATYSAWFKRANIPSSNMNLIGTDGDANNLVQYFFYQGVDDYLRIFDKTGGTTIYDLTTNMVFRDVSAWYHLVISIDTTQAVASDRVKIYVNGSEVSSTLTTSPSLNATIGLTRSSVNMYVGASETGASSLYGYWDGYMSEVCLIDGQALDPTSFGEFDEDTGIWKPKAISGLTFGTNGFYLDFENSGSLGNDKSGNGNNFTVNNLTSIDQTTDTPTNNYATGNPLASQAGSSAGPSSATFSEGNLNISGVSTDTAITNLGVSQGKWYWEVKVVTDQDGLTIGGSNEGYNLDANLGKDSPSSQSNAKIFGYYGGNGNKFSTLGDGSHFTSYGSSIAVNDIIGVALNLDSNEVTFYKNGTSQGAFSITALGSGEVYFPAVGNWSAGGIEVSFNFGSPAFTISSGNSDGNGYGNFEYSVPSGYYALNTKNLSEFG